MVEVSLSLIISDDPRNTVPTGLKTGLSVKVANKTESDPRCLRRLDKDNLRSMFSDLLDAISTEQITKFMNSKASDTELELYNKWEL